MGKEIGGQKDESKKRFLKRQVGDRAVVVPVGEAAKAFHGMINLMEMYEIEYEQAKKSLDTFLAKLREAGSFGRIKMEKKKISSLQWIYSYSRSSLGWILLLAVFSGLIAGSFILLALVSGCLLDIATGSREGSVWLQVLFLVMLILLQAVLNIASSNLRIRVTTKIEMRIKQGCFFYDFEKTISGSQ